MSRGNRTRKSKPKAQTRKPAIAPQPTHNDAKALERYNSKSSGTLKTDSLHHDVAEEYLYTTRSKIHVKISNIYETLTVGRDWISPAGLTLTLLGLILSMNVSRDMPVYKFFLLIILIIVFVASICHLCYRFWKIKTNKPMTVDDVVDEIMNSGNYYENYKNLFTPDSEGEKT